MGITDIVRDVFDPALALDDAPIARTFWKQGADEAVALAGDVAQAGKVEAGRIAAMCAGIKALSVEDRQPAIKAAIDAFGQALKDRGYKAAVVRKSELKAVLVAAAEHDDFQADPDLGLQAQAKAARQHGKAPAEPKAPSVSGVVVQPTLTDAILALIDKAREECEDGFADALQTIGERFKLI